MAGRRPGSSAKACPKEELLSTKLMPSFISGDLLRRYRLFARLSKNPGAKVFLIYGAAGAGKSSLLYDYTRTQDVPVCWYALHETDRDLKVFLTYLLTSIRMHHPSVTEKVFPRLAGMTPAEEEWKGILTSFINEIRLYGKEILVALDDYHFLDGAGDGSPPSSVPALMEFLLLHSPANFRCFIASRTLPKLPLSYLQSKNALVILRPEDLLLDMEELHDLFHGVWKQSLSEKGLRLIHAKTEGWFAAIRLISQAIQDRSLPEVEKILEDLHLKGGMIYDYLAREIYRCQRPDLQSFLRYTSVLSSFNAELAEIVTRLPDVQKSLRELERMNLFVIHLDTKEEWFRYHHLFSDFLQNTLLQEEGKAQVQILHRRAGFWHEEHGNMAEAVEHFLQAGEFEECVRLLKQEGTVFFQRGLLNMLLKWIAAFPRPLREGSPELLLLEGEVHDAGGCWEKAVACYEKALAHLRRNNAMERVPFVLEKLIFCLLKYGEYSKIRNYCHQALEICNPNNKGLRSRLLSWLGIAHAAAGDEEWVKGYELMRSGYALAYEAMDPEAIVVASISYGFAYHFPQGNFLEAQQVFNEGTDLLRRMGLPFLACNQMMNKAVVQIFAGMLEEAEKTIEETSQLVQEYQLHFVAQGLNLARAMLALERKDLAGAKIFLSHVMAQEIPLQLKPWYFRSVALLHLLEGNTQQAEVAGREMMISLDLVGKGVYAPECYLVKGMICWRRHLHYKARRWFEEGLAVAEKGKMKFWIMKAHYCLAALFAILGNATLEFKKHYHMAVRLSKENNYWHLWGIDLFDFTVPIVMEAYRLELEPEETKKIIEMVKPELLKALEKVLGDESFTRRAMACEILGLLGGRDAALLLKKAQRDPREFVRSKACEIFSSSRCALPVLSITTLGEFSITRDHKEISADEWRRRKALTVFKYFLASYPREIVGDQLIETFWPGRPLKVAKTNLCTILNMIRRALNPAGEWGDPMFIRRGQDLYQLCLKGEDYLDLSVFSSLFEEGDRLWKGGEREAAMEKFKKGIQLYRGDFLEGDLYEEWAMKRRGELRQQYLLLLERVGSFYEGKNQFHEALSSYRKYLEAHPLQENVVVSALRCLVALGDRASARKEYLRFKDLMKDQMAQKPSAAIESLMQKIFSSP